MDKAVGRAYGSVKGPDEKYPDFAKRVTFLVDPDGIGRKVYAVTDVAAHPDEVLADIQALAAISDG